MRRAMKDAPQAGAPGDVEEGEQAACRPDGRALRRDAAANRDRIICAANQVFAESGFDATIDDIALRAGVGVGTVYRRFANKAELVDALFEGKVVAVQRLAEKALEDPDAWRGLVGFLTDVQTIQAGNRGLVNALFDRRAVSDGIARQRMRLHDLCDRLVAKAQEQGRLRADFAATDLPLLLLMASTVDLYTRNTAPGTSARMLGLCIDGLRASRRRPSPLPSAALTVEQFDRSLASWRDCPAGRSDEADC